MTATKTVGDGLVDCVTLYKARHWFLRLDVLPFAVAYAVLFAVILQHDLQLEFYGLVGFPLVLFTHMFIFLLSQSSILLKCSVGNYEVNDIDAAELVHVCTAPNSGNDRIVVLFKEPTDQKCTQKFVTIAGNLFHVPVVSFEFQKVTYRYDSDKNTFIRLEYPNVAPLLSMLESTGYKTVDDVAISIRKWGLNEFDIPIPSFLDLYAEHLVAPFFTFQVMCLFLWSLDDYWYYSAFTLLMLMFFEGMLCKQRQVSLLMLRDMRRSPVDMYAWRCDAWVTTSSEHFVPGDIVSLKATAPEPERSVRRRNTAAHTGRGYDDEDDAFLLGSVSDTAVLPCDAVVLRGTCVANEAMLTGESVPQLKESLVVAIGDNCGNADGSSATADVVDLGTDNNINSMWRRHLVFGGTSLLQHSLPARVSSDLAASSTGTGSSHLARARVAVERLPDPPDGGVVALVVRTAFGTTQGGLMRKILFATERINANSSETFKFIGVLVVFAVVASAVVLHHGLGDENRNKFRLALHCIMILTSVVPPELPMELSLAVTNSLAALSRGLVFCTEPFRIPFAGKLDVLCFDKTGTLTKDQMILKGVVTAATVASGGNGDAETTVETDFAELPSATLAVMGGCHTLLVAANSAGGGIVGDPLEKATFAASGFQFVSNARGGSMDSTPVSSPSRGISILVKHRYPFSSALKRMSTIAHSTVLGVDLTETGSEKGAAISSGLYVLTKGAPEVLAHAGLLVNLPPCYRATYELHMSRGKRVLALAYRELSPEEASRSSDLSRAEVEKGLTFAGFLLFDCDLKVDSKSVIRELRVSDHRVVMITGDSSYTAADVAAKLGMTRGADKGLLVLDDVSVASTSGSGKAGTSAPLVWRAISPSSDHANNKLEVPFDVSSGALDDLARQHTLCVTGPALSVLEGGKSSLANSTLIALCPRITIFARVSPSQKEIVIRALNDAGLCTLMCGDGTNDVGALKAAHVGVSIVNDPSLESRIEELHQESGAATGAGGGGSGGKKPKGTSAKERVARAMLEMQAQEADPTIVKLGDASIASPFTARRTSVDCVLTVLRQGRCTLVTTIQVFKVLALNCLVSAYMMSALYLRGLKQGDMQMTASGLITAGLFFFLSQAKPMQHLASIKPPSSVFCRSVSLSIVGQFLVHLACLVATLALCERFLTEEDPTMSADGKFQPNTINSAVFLLSAVMQVNNFVVNYRGHPFTQSIQENVPLWRSVQVIYVALLIVAGGQVEPLNDFLQMAPFPSPDFQASIIGVLVANFALCYGIEKFCQTL